VVDTVKNRKNKTQGKFLENSTITLLIRNFDVLAPTVIGFFAIYGVITIFGKKLSINIFRGRAFAQAFCVASLAAFALESTVFNFPHYLKYFSGGECYITEVSLKDSTTLLTSDGTLAELIFPDKDTTKDTVEKIKTAEACLSQVLRRFHPCKFLS
jgi:ABC-type molybdate transport system permease subunit